MSRDRTLAQVAADTAPHSGAAALLELLFDAGTLRLCLGPWDITVGADVYTAVGTVASVEAHGEAVDGTEGLQFTLSGLDGAVLALVIDEPYKGRLVRLLEQRFDADHVAVGAASVEYIGRMVAMTSSEDVASRTWSVVVQTEQYDAEGRRPVGLRFSDAEQRRRFPDDKGAEYVTALTDRTLARKPKA